jgi:ribose 5-phosphate isomerase B
MSVTVYLAADHRGFKLKEILKEYLESQNYEVKDLGAHSHQLTDDYPNYAIPAAKAVALNRAKGIFLCGSGVGVDIIANKTENIRSALVYDEKRAIQSREHEDVNVICLPADVLDETEAKKIALAFLTTPFSPQKRHLKRLAKIEEHENDEFT